MERVDTVTAFVTRDAPGGRELLVFRHPFGSPDASPFEPSGAHTAGVRLPAGIVDPGESAEMGAIRLVREQTGLSRVDVVRKLGSISGCAPGEVLLTEPFTIGDGRLDRGTLLEKAGERVEEVEVSYWGVRRWVPRAVVTTEVVRHLLQLLPLTSTPDRWTHTVDDWELESYWTPLDANPGLVRGHDRWLELVRSELAQELAS